MEFYATRKQLLKQVVRGFALVVVAIIGICIDEPLVRVMGVLGLILSGPVTYANLARYLTPPAEPDIVIDDWGIRDYIRGWSIPWNAVRSVWVVRSFDVLLLCFDVEEPSLYRQEARGLSGWIQSRLARSNPVLDAPEATIGFGDVEPGIETAIEHVRVIHPELLVDHQAAV